MNIEDKVNVTSINGRYLSEFSVNGGHQMESWKTAITKRNLIAQELASYKYVNFTVNIIHNLSDGNFSLAEVICEDLPRKIDIEKIVNQNL